MTGDGIAKLTFTILGAVAEMMRYQIGAQIADVKAEQRAQGRFNASTPRTTACERFPVGWRFGDTGSRIWGGRSAPSRLGQERHGHGTTAGVAGPQSCRQGNEATTD